MSPTIRLLGTLFVLFAIAQSAPMGGGQKQQQNGTISSLLVNKVNGRTTSWKAQANHRIGLLSAETRKRMLGLKAFHDGSLEKHRQQLAHKKSANKGPLKTVMAEPLPMEFDSRKHFGECAALINTIQDQGQCGSCWAVSSASVMQDRICIGSKGAQRVNISAQDILSCETEPNQGCDGGYPENAFLRWADQGVVTGSDSSANQGCKPYPFLTHSTVEYQTSKCKEECENLRYAKAYEEDKHFGHSVHSLHFATEEDIKQEIMTNGPVEANMVIFEDFFFYGEGVYMNVVGDPVGGHAVRIVGWGMEDHEGFGLPYWLVANSWGADWGEQGYFRILRGNDECLIESWSINYGLASGE